MALWSSSPHPRAGAMVNWEQRSPVQGHEHTMPGRESQPPPPTPGLRPSGRSRARGVEEGVGSGAAGLGGLGPGPQGSSGLWREARDGREKFGFEPPAPPPPGLFRDDLFFPIRGHQQLMISGKGHACGHCEHFSHSWGPGKIDRGLGRRGSRGVPLSLKLQPARPRTFPLPGSEGPSTQLHPGPRRPPTPTPPLQRPLRPGGGTGGRGEPGVPGWGREARCAPAPPEKRSPAGAWHLKVRFG